MASIIAEEFTAFENAVYQSARPDPAGYLMFWEFRAEHAPQTGV
jgi:hypothetical protein